MGVTTSAVKRKSEETVPYVLSMTTTPWRLNEDLEKRMFELLDGLPPNYVLVLNVPYTFKRDGSAYPAVPSGLAHHPRVQIVRVEDIGPITKVLPTLKRLSNMQPCVVIVIDDDVLYPPAYIKELASGVTPKSKFIKGRTSGAYYHAGTVPEGVSGYAIPSGVVTPPLVAALEQTSKIKDCFGTDDYVVAAALQKLNVPVIDYNTMVKITPLAAMEPGSLAFISVSSGNDFRARYNACKTQISAM